MTRDANDVLRENGPNALRDAFDKAPRRNTGNIANATPTQAEAESNISATPFRWREPAKIPTSAAVWPPLCSTVSDLYDRVIRDRKNIARHQRSAVNDKRQAPAWHHTSERARVWMWNGEDPRDELDRRIEAAMLHYGLNPADVEGYLFTDVGREMPDHHRDADPARRDHREPVVDAVIATIRQNRIDVLIIDPFIKSHKVTENDNNAMDMVATEWAHIADVTNCAIELLHHPRKTGGIDVSVEDGRGAGAVVSASRSARVLNHMSREDAVEGRDRGQHAWRLFQGR